MQILGMCVERYVRVLEVSLRYHPYASFAVLEQKSRYQQNINLITA